MERAVIKSKQHILLTGPPGIGKTTLVKKIFELLRAKGVPVNGFYTEEVRNCGKRIGFDIITLDGNRQILARIGNEDDAERKYTLGQYSVAVKSFESAALPVFQQKATEGGVLIIDEIGRMELFSSNFQENVKNAFVNGSDVILATIPVPKGRPIQFVDYLRKRPDTKIITVDTQNRNNLTEEVVCMLSESLNTA